MEGDAALRLARQTVDMVRPEAERAAFGDDRLDVYAPNTWVRLHERAHHHADRPRRDVVVVPAGVVPGGPADQPDVYVLVAVDRGVVPAPPGVGNLATPQLRALGQLFGEFSQL